LVQPEDMGDNLVLIGF